MVSGIKVVMAQINVTVGDIPGNTERVLEATREAVDRHGADLVVFPELAITGYPPEDLLLRPSIVPRVEEALERLRAEAPPATLVLGSPWSVEGDLYNAAVVIQPGTEHPPACKQHLPNYHVFDEARYFQPGQGTAIFELHGIRTAITVCEDLWYEGPIADAAAGGAQLLININASPYHLDKHGDREALLEKRSREHSLPIVYVNLVGGQDELVFDGGSMAFDGQGEKVVQAPQFEAGLYPLEVLGEGEICRPVRQAPGETLSQEAAAYRALVLGLQDYIGKNGFPSVVLGLSGGIDSALTLAVAVDALGADRVTAVMMPFRYTSSMSLEDAEALAANLGVRYQVTPIEATYDAFMETLSASFGDRPVDTTEENLQARIRGTLLMSLSNKFGGLVLTTGNKSELAVGYSTLYGDMAGGFSVIKDVPKTLVYRLSRWRNRNGEVIPQRIIERAPSAELAPDQKDEDSLPPYEILDQILERYVEQDQSAETIIAAGFDREAVMHAVRLVDINEYKRQQSPVGTRITRRGFGKDRRYPITNRWKPGI
ncbi:NAD+ synthase (glutamine-hydrolysing) [Halospina denitrificans]|uniref:Glutamine-dependent NAD(+) synthetase n=1 Tax=Halospina denitrificans TaxID=332522 RepID=A0A4R7JH37_9GAMM|nr:NAD+ synthase [Halospina denitrificans]TDT37131.1 NAD+ synthase (glutamine-hydrolysing) [Halospina denitrificans]